MSGNVDLSHFFLTSAWYFFIWICQCLFNISHVGGFLHCFEYFASILKKQTIHSRRYINGLLLHEKILNSINHQRNAN